MTTVLIIGASSPIAAAIAARFAEEGVAVVLAGRNLSRVQTVVDQLRASGFSNVGSREVDVENPGSVDRFMAPFEAECPDVVISVLGRQLLSDEPQYRQLRGLISVNLTAPAELLERFSEIMSRKRSGCLIGVSSVVGDRGRRKNYPYGAAKAGFNAYLSGLRQRLNPLGIDVITVKPGVVGKPNVTTTHPRWMVTTPERVASDIFTAWEKRKSVIYTPGYWRWVMALIRLIPESVFRRLSF